MEIILKADDPRIGTPGNPPKTDVMGNPYQRPVLNRMELGQARYAVLPVFMDEVIAVRLEETTPFVMPPAGTVMPLVAEIDWEQPEDTSLDQAFEPVNPRKGK